MSRSCAVTDASTYALILCCVARALSALAPIVSSSRIVYTVEPVPSRKVPETCSLSSEAPSIVNISVPLLSLKDNSSAVPTDIEPRRVPSFLKDISSPAASKIISAPESRVKLPVSAEAIIV